MRERIKDPNILRVYATIFLLGIAYGMSLGLTPIYLKEMTGASKDFGFAFRSSGRAIR